MKNKTKKQSHQFILKPVYAVSFLAVILISPLLIGHSYADSPHGYFSPSSGAYNTGNQFSVNLHIVTVSGWDAATVDFSTNTNLQYLGGSIPNGNSDDSITYLGNGEYQVYYFSDTIVDGDTTIANLNFKAISVGTGTITMDSASVKNDSSYYGYSVPTENASFSITQPSSPASTSTPPTTTSESTNSTSSIKTSTPAKTTDVTTSTPPTTSTPIISTIVPSNSSPAPTNNEPNTSKNIGALSSKNKTKTKNVHSNSGRNISLAIIGILAFVAFVIFIRRRSSKTYDNYSDAASALPPVNLPASTPTPTVSYDTTPPKVNEAINRSIDRAFYPLRYKNEKTHKP